MPEHSPGTFSRLVHLFRNTLQGWRDAPSRSDRHALAQTKRPWDADIGLTLGALLYRDQTKASGTVEVLSLAEFRDDLGSLWIDYADRILLIAETTIARMIGKGHTFIPRGDDTWLLLFPGLTIAEASERAEAIAARIGEKLMGLRFTPQEPPLPTTATLDLTGVVASDGKIDVAALTAAVTRARAGLKAVDTSRATSAAAKPADGARVALTNNLQPAWNAATQVVDTFFLRPLAGGENLVLDPDVAFSAATATILCATAEELVQKMETSQLRAKLALPVPYGLAAGSGGPAIAERIGAIARNIRLLHLRLEIARLPHNATLEGMAHVRELFRPLVRDVAFLGDGFALPPELFALEHITVGVDLAFRRGWSDTDLRALLLDTRRRASRQPVYVLGLRNSAHVKIALEAAVDELGGPILLGDQPQLPARLTIISREQLSK